MVDGDGFQAATTLGGEMSDDNPVVVANLVRAAHREVGEVRDGVQQINARMERFEHSMLELLRQNSQLFEALARLDGRLDGIVDEVRHVRRDVDELKRDVHKLRTDVDDVQRWRDALPPPRVDPIQLATAKKPKRTAKRRR
jgi:predicted nuclease with TOPRIM domain